MAQRNAASTHGVDMMWFQQGDVLITPATLPADAHLAGEGILARGEATGHAHRLDAATDGLLYETSDGRLFLRVGPQGARITHEEHRPVVVPQGEYVIGRVREYDHFAEEARQVRD